MASIRKYKKIVGVDLGGTNVRAGLVNNDKISKTSSNLVPMRASNPNDILSTIFKTIDEIWDKDVRSIGIGVPGIVERKTGIVYDIQNIPAWKKVRLKDKMEKYYNVPVFIDNDANCFTIGEHLFGKGRNARNFVGVTIGTGIGAGIFVNGKLLSDTNCGSGEFGMIPYKDSIFEDYCSGKFFSKNYLLSGEVLFEKAQAKDKASIMIFKEFGGHLGKIIKTIMHSVDPEKIIIGGSVAKSKDFYFAQMLEEINDFPYQKQKNNIDIDFSDLDNPAIFGAAALCLLN